MGKRRIVDDVESVFADLVSLDSNQNLTVAKGKEKVETIQDSIWFYRYSSFVWIELIAGKKIAVEMEHGKQLLKLKNVMMRSVI